MRHQLAGSAGSAEDEEPVGGGNAEGGAAEAVVAPFYQGITRQATIDDSPATPFIVCVRMRASKNGGGASRETRPVRRRSRSWNSDGLPRSSSATSVPPIDVPSRIRTFPLRCRLGMKAIPP